MNTTLSVSTGRIAIITAIAALFGLIFIALFYMLPENDSGPFGTLNDLCVALGGLLSGSLAWMLYQVHRSYQLSASRFALGGGWIGALLAPLGSGLVILNITGWFLAGLVTTFGYALLGLWLVGLNYSALHWPAFPRGLAQFGIVAGGVMMIGILAGPAILAHIDTIESAPWFALIALFVGGLGWNMVGASIVIWKTGTKSSCSRDGQPYCLISMRAPLPAQPQNGPRPRPLQRCAIFHEIQISQGQS